jgi:hypothetical protein
MSHNECSNHICNKIKKKEESPSYYCDYCGKGSFTRHQTFPISIQYFRNNILFHLDFHNSCFELFSIANYLKFCNECSTYYSEEPA